MLLEADGLKYIYMPGTPYQVEALRGVSLAIEQGEFAGIMGSTGSGKSTLLQILGGLLRPSEGTVRVRSEKATEGYLHGFPLVGLVFQHPEQQLFAETVYQEVAFGPGNQGLSPREIEKRVRESLESMELDYENTKDRSPFELSRGLMRRVALAGVISMYPDILILDEPTAGLDPRGREEFLKHVTSLHRSRKITMIMVSHRPLELVPYADRIFILHHGEIALRGTPAEVFARSREIKDMGIEIPPAVDLWERLREKGFNLKPGVITEEEACQEILKWDSREGDTHEP